jgi:ATP-binding cassette subfamily C protein LapB
MMRRRWQKAVITQSELALHQRMWSSFAANVANLSQQLVQVGVITVGFFLVGKGQLGFGAIIACTILSGRAISPLAQLAQLLTRVNQSLTSYRALSELMSAPREHAGAEHYVSRPGFEGAIEFRDVTFTYPGASRPALRGVSFKLAPGEKLAVLGRAGSGKTTLSKLVLGLYPPDEGAVLLDGVDVRQIDPAELRARVGAVLQEVWLIAGTVRDNITLGSHAVSDEALVRAARLAGVEDFISQHPQGYALRLGERGEGLSGGQRQAVALARALVGEPPILVLDEPSSAMDQSAETKLVERLKTVLTGRTVLLITHKAGIMALAERVLVLEEGRAIYDGPPSKLLGGQA